MWKERLLTLALTLVCLMVGYGFYRFNQRDTVNAIFFTIGIMGIMLSVLRERKK